MLAQLRLLQMASQALPIGSYSHSFGLEAAVESRLVTDESSVQRWITDVLSHSLLRFELPLLRDMHEAWNAQRVAGLRELNQEFLATRESAEMRAATVQMGRSLRTLLGALPLVPTHIANLLNDVEEPTLPLAWSATAAAWEVAARESMAAYLWSWAENQVLVAMKVIPIGQSAGQRVLLKIGAAIAQIDPLGDHPRELRSNFTPGLAILCSQHESQYSRLFRS